MFDHNDPRHAFVKAVNDIVADYESSEARHASLYIHHIDEPNLAERADWERAARRASAAASAVREMASKIVTLVWRHFPNSVLVSPPPTAEGAITDAGMPQAEKERYF